MNVAYRHPYVEEAIRRLPKAPTHIVGIGRQNAAAARYLGEVCSIKVSISIALPIIYPERATTIGLVSGTDDLSFLDPLLIRKLRLEQAEIQSLSQSTRISAVKEARELVKEGLKPVPNTLEREIVLCVADEIISHCLRYQLELLRSRNPEELILISSDTLACRSLMWEGVIQSFITQQDMTEGEKK